MKRLFAALKINPDPGFLSSYRNLRAVFNHEKIKWVEEKNIHITLKFFGEIDDKKLPAISSVLKNRAETTLYIPVRLNGLGIFGSSYAPKVIWMGVEPFEQISLLMKNIHGDLANIGYEPDRQNLVPHLTLGRIKSLNDKTLFQRTMDQFRTISSSPFHIREVILFESILHQNGPEYVELEKFFFKNELP